MRARFTFISLLLLILVGTGYFLSYMGGFLTIDREELRASVRFWESPPERIEIPAAPVRR